jgi:hypothetical protein
MPRNGGDGRQWLLIAPDGVVSSPTRHMDRIVRCLALVGTARFVVGTLKNAKVNVARWKVVDGSVGRFRQHQRRVRVRNDATRKDDTGPAAFRPDSDRVIRRACLLVNRVGNVGLS